MNIKQKKAQIQHQKLLAVCSVGVPPTMIEKIKLATNKADITSAVWIGRIMRRVAMIAARKGIT